MLIKRKNTDAISVTYSLSRNVDGSRKLVWRDGRRALIVKEKEANTNAGAMTKPVIRTVQPSPMEGSFRSLERTTG